MLTATDLLDLPNTAQIENTIYIVSSKFRDFCDSEQIWDYQTALENLHRIARNVDKIILGQGLGHEQRQRLLESLKFLSDSRSILVQDHIHQRVCKEKVHKIRDNNVMVSSPQRVNERTFEAYLVVDENCAEMSDHQTGEHVQGAVLIEAARQMFMACATTFELSPEASAKLGDMQFALNEMRVVFHNFIFPIETRIELHFDGANVREKAAEGKAHIVFYQNEKVCCEVFCIAQAFSKKMLKILETKSARSARRSAIH
ncbi:MAG TPA: AfsA-related hotdog domain-containing protein [Cellvibrionaceae bacterium]